MVEVGQWGPEPFLDRSGRPLTSLTITVYETDGTTLADLYTNQDGDTALANPLPTGVATTAAGLDVRGNGNFYAEPGAYVLAASYEGDEVYRSPITVSIDTGGSGSGAVDSVNGQTGVVVLDATDVGADPAGTAASAVAASEAGQVRDGDTAGGVLASTYPNPTFAVDMATQAELDAHVTDATGAHADTAISYTGILLPVTNVRDGLNVLQSDKMDSAAAVAAFVALAGDQTVAGIKTLNDGLILSTASFSIVGSAAASDAMVVRVTGDTQERLIVDSDGTLRWSSGAATQDTNLYRGAAGELKSDGAIIAAAAGAGAKIGAVGPSFKAALQFGATGDTTLYRDAADVLRTADALTVDGRSTLAAADSKTLTVAATGATETLDLAVYGAFDLTMDQACTFTFSNPGPSGTLSVFVLVLRGAFTPTWPAAVDWTSGTPPTYTTPSVYTFSTVDAGTTWLGAQVGRAFA